MKVKSRFRYFLLLFIVLGLMSLSLAEVSVQSLYSSDDLQQQANAAQTVTSQDWLKDAINECKKNAPTYSPQCWNWPWWIKNSTNCYAYAFDMTKDPRSGQLFPKYLGLQPGILSLQKFNPELYDGTKETDEEFIETVTNDMDSIGYSFLEADQDAAIPDQAYMVALAIFPGDFYNDGDYHWYRLNPDGTWSNKLGFGSVTNVDESGNIITDPWAADRGCYVDFVGYFYVTKSN